MLEKDLYLIPKNSLCVHIFYKTAKIAHCSEHNDTYVKKQDEYRYVGDIVNHSANQTYQSTQSQKCISDEQNPKRPFHVKTFNHVYQINFMLFCGGFLHFPG